jgi:hypothetical protein
MIDIGGNMTSVEQFEVQAVLPVGGASCQTIQLSQSSAAYARVVAAGASSTGPSAAGTQAVLTSMFQPDSASQFIVRLMDDTGHAQYLATCPTNPVGMNGNQAYVSVDARTPVLTAANTGNVGGVSGFGSGRAWVNPVQVVRWELVAASSGIEPAGFSAMAGESFGGNDAGIDPYKYDLIRSFVGMDNNRISATVDVVAEYAVDLDFAFSVETGTVALPSILTYAFGDANNAVAAGATYPYPQPGAVPERLRAVRVRLAARVAQPDRSRSVSLAAAAPYIYRYCVSATACAAVGDPNLPLWARARTITTEVSLPNLATDFF